MSQFSTMTTNERKLQAAAICREIQGPEDAEMDLGRRESYGHVMLEELSLASNRGSLLFEKRKRRSEKYTFENIQNVTNTQINNGVTLQTESQETKENSLSVEQQLSKTPQNMSDLSTAPNPDNIAPGYGGPLKEMEPEKFNRTCLPKSYHSPWDQAIYHHDPSLADSLVTCLQEPEAKPEGPGYKSFNRVATPFRGFGGKSTRPAPMFKAPEVEHNPMPELYPELQAEPAVQRPTFNRVACGWAGTSAPLILPTVPLVPMLIPESDDL
ncbi:myozenin-2 [Salvelinus sp. IW2-2015]|uniref:myozenin-2 n=1 Tax=Salvelinus sp. IW2-2015 TaxID=2691554 RepID=UPI000CDF8DEE|nr:myozenin-2 [Salvelinus alpinus]